MEPDELRNADEIAALADQALNVVAQKEDDQMRILGALVIEMSKLELRKLELEAELESVNRELTQYSTKTVPNQMLDMGVDSITMKGSGAEVRIENHIRCGLPKDEVKKKDAYAWLKVTGNDELIKRDVTVSFDKSSTDEAERLMALLGDTGFDKTAEVKYEWTIHNSTLGKFVRDTLSQESDVKSDGGEPENPLPREAFGVFESKVAVIHRKKTRR